ncbi:hypothetical protein GPJ61_27745 [Brevibacillus formosus]|uniref:hypothetical protein n=1 Tax=Brevibacillus formosus TaxID=54913 RepID=UPI001CA4FA6C|nr:hypothetical protein [Brevibacillus formosus]MBW5471584.1 hypothetical protein [Brevibacillus formosus]
MISVAIKKEMLGKTQQQPLTKDMVELFREVLSNKDHHEAKEILHDAKKNRIFSN